MSGLTPMTVEQALDFADRAAKFGAVRPEAHDPVDLAEVANEALSAVVILAIELRLARQHVKGQDEALLEMEELLDFVRTGRKPSEGPLQAPDGPWGVAWTGKSADYFENMPAINHEIALEVASMFRASGNGDLAVEIEQNSSKWPQIGPNPTE